MPCAVRRCSRASVRRAFPAQPFSVEQVSPREVDAKAGLVEVGDPSRYWCSAASPSSRSAWQRAWTPSAHSVPAALGDLGHPFVARRRRRHSARCGRRPQRARRAARSDHQIPLGRSSKARAAASARSLVAAEPVLEHSTGPFGEGDPDSLSTGGASFGGLDQGGRRQVFRARPPGLDHRTAEGGCRSLRRGL